MEKEEKEERKQEEEKERAETKRTEGAKGFVVVLVLFLDKQSLHSRHGCVILMRRFSWRSCFIFRKFPAIKLILVKHAATVLKKGIGENI